MMIMFLIFIFNNFIVILTEFIVIVVMIGCFIIKIYVDMKININMMIVIVYFINLFFIVKIIVIVCLMPELNYDSYLIII